MPQPQHFPGAGAGLGRALLVQDAVHDPGEIEQAADRLRGVEVVVHRLAKRGLGGRHLGRHGALRRRRVVQAPHAGALERRAESLVGDLRL